jgi:hypothetical protein
MNEYQENDEMLAAASTIAHNYVDKNRGASKEIVNYFFS